MFTANLEVIESRFFSRFVEHNLRAQTRLNIWPLPIGVAGLVVLDLVAPYQGWVILMVGLGGALLIGHIWTRELARGLAFSRQVRFGWAQVGDQLEERLTLVNQSWLPALWIEVIDHSTLPGYDTSCAIGIDARATNHRLAHGMCLQRGAFTLGPTTLRTGDPFGIFTLTLESISTEKMMVLPPIVPLPNIEIAAGGRVREGRLQASASEHTVNTSSVRDYAPGDAVNMIHWRTVARRDELFVRVLDTMPSGDWRIFLDLNESVQAGQGQQSTLEHGIIYAASLATRGLRDGRAVGLIASSNDLIWLPPREGEAQRWEILRALALAQRGTRSFSDLLLHTQSGFKQSSLIIITPDLNGKWIDALLPFLWRGSVPTILLLDSVSFGGTGDIHNISSLLSEMEITHYLMGRDVLDLADTMPGTLGRPDWRITPRGRAILTRPMRDAHWRTLA